MDCNAATGENPAIAAPGGGEFLLTRSFARKQTMYDGHHEQRSRDVEE
jgi:hypothetical protein